jgi:ABC-type enterochelin transport system substrate-binding protein
MMTKKDIIAANPTIKIGIGNETFEVSSGNDYDNYINILFETEQENEKAAEIAAEKHAAKTVAQGKLAALGLTTEDLEALGL